MAADLDVKDHTAMDEILNDVKFYNTNRNLLLYKIKGFNYSKSTDVK